MKNFLLLIAVSLWGLFLFEDYFQSEKKRADPDYLSVGRVTAGGCMSESLFNSAATSVVNNTDWQKIYGAAQINAATRRLIGGIKVFEEMQRLGTPACPDILPLYQQFVAANRIGEQPASAPPTQVVNATPTSSPILVVKKVTVKAGANIRTGPSTTHPVLRTAKPGDVLRIFDTKDGWIQIGIDAPEGWIAASLVTQ